MTRAVPATLRFESGIERMPWSGCWIWTKCTNSSGYGSICVGGKIKNTHRFSWELHRGTIPEGQSVLHHCDTPACANPDHLYLGDQKKNLNDGQAKGRVYRQPDHECKNGHPAIPENVYFTHGHRYCLLCKRESRRRAKG